MRVWYSTLAPLVLAGASVIACGQAGRRSSFAQDKAATDPKGGFGDDLGNTGDGGVTDDNCSAAQTTITRTPVVIEFVVDQSGSMNDPATGSKWASASEALKAVIDDMNAVGDPATFVGLTLFPANSGGFLGFGGGGGPSNVAPKAFSDPTVHDAMTKLVDKPTAGGSGTPTQSALTAAYKLVEKFQPPAASGLSQTDLKRIVVLVSDGAPNGGDTEKQACEDLAMAKQSELPAAFGPILTYSVGIGVFPSPNAADYDPAFMSRLAQQGGTARPGCDPDATDASALCHFQITPGDDVAVAKEALLQALNTIRALSVSCTFGFNATKDTDLKKLQVTVTDKDGTVSAIPKDADNGWSFDDPANPTQVVLNGDACAATSGTISGRVDVVLGCRGAN